MLCSWHNKPGGSLGMRNGINGSAEHIPNYMAYIITADYRCYTSYILNGGGGIARSPEK